MPGKVDFSQLDPIATLGLEQSTMRGRGGRLVNDGLDVEPFRLDLTQAEDVAALIIHV
jgi:hypothetical protein